MNGRQDDNLFKASIAIVICAYFLLGNVMLGSGFSWSPNFHLQSIGNRPTEVSRYELKFTSINGEPLDSPIYFSDMAGMLGNDDIYEGKRLVNRLGHAIYSDDVVTANELNNELEKVYLSTFDSAEYEVVFINTNPVEKYHNGLDVSEWVLFEYSIPLGESIALED